MGFASAWLEKNTLFPRLIDADPVTGTGIIVVIPSYGEGDISSTIESLSKCSIPPCPCEVIVVVNAPQDADDSSIEENKRTVSILKAWTNSKNCFFRLSFVDMGISSFPHWGVGYARKAGMDEAIRRFDMINLPQGVIASLDADCIVSENYFFELYRQLYQNPKKCACALTLFNGRVDEGFPDDLIHAAEKYELSRRYVLLGMRYGGYPWCFYIAGSALAVKADTYVKAGGMNKREAGEDFWFVRKILPVAGFFTTCGIIINHSARISKRVPFGTGMSINDLTSMPETINTLCDPSIFDDLKVIWNVPGKLFGCSIDEITDFYSCFPKMLKAFVPEKKFVNDLMEISSNTSSTATFEKRYFLKYDMLFGQRYINYAIREHNKVMDMLQACSCLADKTGLKKTEISSYYSALSFYRDSEAWISCSPS